MNLGVDQWALVVSVASLLLALLLVPAVRRPFKALRGKLGQLIGTDARRYRSWFERHHGKLKNVYLDRTETLSLRDTYVPLAGYKGNAAERISATEVLHDPDTPRMIVLGDPGGGKSTLLRAFGTSLVNGSRTKSGSALTGPLAHTPVLVPLRAFARYLESHRTLGGSLRTYIQDEILERAAKVRQGHRLLTGLLDNRRLLLLLDGLDEVPDAMVREVRTEVLSFIDTGDMRVVLTCRRQNFLAVRTDWIPVLTDRTYTLAPLRDDEVLAFIHRRVKEFTPPKTPSDLFQSINQSGTLELHRVPMILTVSIALYIHLTGYRIPTSLASFYDEMIKQLLTRHDFRLEHAGSVNVFSADDKLRFMREFSYRAATRSGRLEDFSIATLVSVAEELSDRLTSVRRGEGEKLVDEIINRSGLIAQASVEAEYAFAHRSIQEYLIASRLMGDPQAGAEFLLTMADEAEWRLVAIFFASFEHNYVEYFLRELHSRNLELCGHCMASARIADRTLAADTIYALRDQVLAPASPADRASAFAAITMLANAPQPWMRDKAVRALLVCVERMTTVSAEINDFLGLDQDAMARVLSGLAGITNEYVLVRTVANLASLPAVDNLRNIQPLWSIYWTEAAADDSLELASLSMIAQRLVQLCGTPEGLRELQAQPPPPVTPEILEFAPLAYPFAYGLTRGSNLPLLLASIRRYRLDVSNTNVIAQAVSMDDPNLATLERDHRRRTKRIYLFWPARIVTIAAYLGSILLIVSAIATDSWKSLLFNTRTIYFDNLYYLLPGLVATAGALIAAEVSTNRKNHNVELYRGRGLLRLPWNSAREYTSLDGTSLGRGLEGTWPEHSGSTVKTANPMVGWVDIRFDALFGGYAKIDDLEAWVFVLTVSLTTLPLTLGVHEIAGPEPLIVIVMGAIVTFLCFWLPATYLCARGVPVDLRRRNPLTAAYLDPTCAHWLRPATA